MVPLNAREEERGKNAQGRKRPDHHWLCHQLGCIRPPVRRALVLARRQAGGDVSKALVHRFLTTLLEIDAYARDARSKALTEGRSWLSGLQLLDQRECGLAALDDALSVLNRVTFKLKSDWRRY